MYVDKSERSEYNDSNLVFLPFSNKGIYKESQLAAILLRSSTEETDLTLTSILNMQLLDLHMETPEA